LRHRIATVLERQDFKGLTVAFSSQGGMVEKKIDRRILEPIALIQFAPICSFALICGALMFALAGTQRRRATMILFRGG
jgi:hypothetical protein